MSDPLPRDRAVARGGPQVIPRPAKWRLGPGPTWSGLDSITVADIRAGLDRRSSRPESAAERAGWARRGQELVAVALPGPARRPAAVLCALFEEEGQAHVVLTRRSSRLRSHTHQVSFPGGRIDPGETPFQAALREAREEVGLNPSEIEALGQLSLVHTAANPAPITPFVVSLPGRPVLTPNPAEVERAFTVPLVELTDPEVYRDELWTVPDGSERQMWVFELVGDTVWGATAWMLAELLGSLAEG